jgi:hypothetical protein
MLSITYSPEQNLSWQVVTATGTLLAATSTPALAAAVAEVILTEQSGDQS